MTIATRPASRAAQPGTGDRKVSILGDPIALIRQDHIRQLEICADLESIADSLPHDVDKTLCERLSALLPVSLKLHHKDEERALLPILRQIPQIAETVKTVQDRLEEEHTTDEDFADELAAALADVADLGWPENPEMLGYMLRGYFESHRRHIAWEEAVLLPLADAHLSRSQRHDMAAIMAENRNIQASAH
ncbi:MAG: hemerythrin domain-containing protein [Alphaproteobacteria bacterium]|nr:hemerythrin domain-containing protein [Alphaproteobacteria bacterium]